MYFYLDKTNHVPAERCISQTRIHQLQVCTLLRLLLVRFLPFFFLGSKFCKNRTFSNGFFLNIWCSYEMSNFNSSKRYKQKTTQQWSKNNEKELNLCHKLKMSILYIFATWLGKPLIFQTLIIWCNRIHSLNI